MSEARPRRAAVQSALALFGLVLMIASIVYLQLLPRGERKGAKPSLAETKANARVVIDAGHGGKDSGAMRNGVMEKDLTLDVALRLQKRLQAAGAATILTRSGDEFISLAGRAAAANREEECVFVSIHFDEGNRAAATGVQTFYAAKQMQNSSLPSWLP